jgi:hypothetical protein
MSELEKFPKGDMKVVQRKHSASAGGTVITHVQE